MIRLRITPDGRIRGLWTDALDWPALGRVHVARASQVEFDITRQVWVVHPAPPVARLRGGIRALRLLLSRAHWALRGLLRRGPGRVPADALPTFQSRSAALDWEAQYFGPGGSGWPNT